MYCPRHRVRPDNSVAHERPQFHPALLASWRLHYAKTYAHLPSSAALLEEVGPGARRGGCRCSRRRMAWGCKRLHTPVAHLQLEQRAAVGMCFREA